MQRLALTAVALLVGSLFIDARSVSAGGWRDCPCGGYARYAPGPAYNYGPPVYYYAPQVYPPAYYVPPPAYGYYAAPPGYGFYMAYPAQPPVYGGYYGYARWRRW